MPLNTSNTKDDMQVCVREREKESVCVYVCAYKCVCACVCVCVVETWCFLQGGGNVCVESVCVCVFVIERECMFKGGSDVCVELCE